MKATQVLLLFFIIFVTLLGCSRRDTTPPSPPAAVGSQEELSSEAKKELHQVKKDLERGHTIIIGDEDITEQLKENESQESLLSAALTRIVNSIPPGKDKAVCLSCLHQGMGKYVMQHFLQPIFPPAEYLIQNNPNSYCKHIVDKAWTRVTCEYDFLIGSSSEDKPLASLDIEERKKRTVQTKAVFQIGGSQPPRAVCVNSECSDELPLYLIPAKSKLSNPLGWSPDDIKGLIKSAGAPGAVQPVSASLAEEEAAKKIQDAWKSYKSRQSASEAEEESAKTIQEAGKLYKLSKREEIERKQVQRDLDGGSEITIGDENITEQLSQNRSDKSLLNAALDRILASIPPDKDKATCLSCLNQGMGACVMQHVLAPVFPPEEGYLHMHNHNVPSTHTVDEEWKTVTFERSFSILNSSECEGKTREQILAGEEAQKRIVHAKAVFQIGGSKPWWAVWVNKECKDELPLYLIPAKSKLSNPLGLTMKQIKDRIQQQQSNCLFAGYNTLDGAGAPNQLFSNTVLSSTDSIAKGKTYFETMLKGDQAWVRYKKSPQEALGHVMNFLYHAAAKKNQQFDEGTYIVEVSEKFLTLLQGLSGVYSRPSSHRHPLELKGSENHYGFDLRDVKIYPEGKKHILFFPLKNKEGKHYCFIKPENYGTAYPRDRIMHAYEYGVSLLKRVGVLSIDPHNEVHRKERAEYLHPEIQTLAQELIDTLCGNGIENTEEGFVSILNPQELKENYQRQGLCYLIELFNQHMAGRSETDPLVEKLLAMYKKHQLDHPSERVAQEVILKLDELLEPAIATSFRSTS